MFSRRTTHVPPVNRLAAAVARARAQGREILDLTVSNPTAAGIEYPVDEIAAALEKGARAPYEPAALGLPSARATVASRLWCSHGDIVLTASTSEAYAFLFKLLADPGDEILTARPAYPLLDHLAAAESCVTRQFPLTWEPGHRWTIDPHALRESLTPTTRAVVLVHPNNPTGSFVRPDEARAVAELCAARDLALVSDEVFLPYPLEAPPTPSLADLDLPCLTFALGGLSKEGGMPHLKLGWIRVAGPTSLRRQAVERLELVADNALSVATPVQAALPELFAIGDTIRPRIAERTRASLAILRETLASRPHVECLTVEGGWSAVLRFPALVPDEDFALRLLQEQSVLVHPGHFFDFERDGFVVVSLLAAEAGRGVEGMLNVEC